MSIVDNIFDIQTFNVAGVTGQSALTDTPLVNYTGNIRTLSGTINLADGSDQLTGTGTAFTSELEVGQTIRVGPQSLTVASIESDTAATLTSNSTEDETDATANVDNPPIAENFIRFATISEIDFN